jgi:hypothetical protein
MAISVGFRSIQSGAVVNGGGDIVLHARADDGEAHVLLPAEEASGLAILLLQLLQLSREARANGTSVDSPSLAGESITAARDPSPDRETLQIQIASDATASGSKAAVLRVSLPREALLTFARSILAGAADGGARQGSK